MPATQKTNQPLKILFPVSECIPLAKTGGLADVAGALPKALAELGHEVHVVMPFYRQIRKSGISCEPSKIEVRVPLGSETVTARIFVTELPGSKVKVHLVEHEPFFDRAELYRSGDDDYTDNDRRFVFFDRAVMELGKALGPVWDIVHVHDWHTGFIPVYLKTLYADEPAFRHARSLISIHNLAYQGVYDFHTLGLAGLPDSLFVPEKLEFWGKVNFLKAGLVYADWINAVSPTYAEEIQTPEVGYGLDGVLRSRSRNVSGILNGIDYSLWDPAHDALLKTHYQAGDLKGKAQLKQDLLEEQKLFPIEGAPLIGIISRLDDQKGFDLIAEISDRLLEMKIQIVLLGTGVKKYHDLFLALKARHPRHLGLNLLFDNALAHRIYAGCDMFLMPSKFEPCGLGQLISMRYGTIPVVRHTGGLADTVADHDGRKGNGFMFREYTGHALLGAVMRACEAYAQPAAWHKLMQTAMAADFSWTQSAKEYVALYRKMLKTKTAG